MPQMCEGCDTRASSGLTEERRTRWCGTCAKAHGGAVNNAHKMCEGCGEKRATFAEGLHTAVLSPACVPSSSVNWSPILNSRVREAACQPAVSFSSS
jgi:hypothetical protein